VAVAADAILDLLAHPVQQEVAEVEGLLQAEQVVQVILHLLVPVKVITEALL